MTIILERSLMPVSDLVFHNVHHVRLSKHKLLSCLGEETGNIVIMTLANHHSQPCTSSYMIGGGHTRSSARHGAPAGNCQLTRYPAGSGVPEGSCLFKHAPLHKYGWHGELLPQSNELILSFFIIPPDRSIPSLPPFLHHL